MGIFLRSDSAWLDRIAADFPVARHAASSKSEFNIRDVGADVTRDDVHHRCASARSVARYSSHRFDRCVVGVCCNVLHNVDWFCGVCDFATTIVDKSWVGRRSPFVLVAEWSASCDRWRLPIFEIERELPFSFIMSSYLRFNNSARVIAASRVINFGV